MQVNDGNCGARRPDNQQRPNNYTSNYLLVAMRTDWGTRKGAEEGQSRGWRCVHTPRWDRRCHLWLI